MSKLDHLTPVLDPDGKRGPQPAIAPQAALAHAFLHLTDLMLSIQDSQTEMVEQYVDGKFSISELAAQAMENELLQAASVVNDIRLALVQL